MRIFQTLKTLNPLGKLGPSPAARVSAALEAGQSLGDVMRDSSDAIARQAVRDALEEFSDGPAALLITCLIESTAEGYERLGLELTRSSQLPRESAAWVAARLTGYGQSLNNDLMSQHLINLVLSVTGLHVEALILTRADVDARRLTDRLAELLKQGLSSGVSRSDLAQTLPAPRRTSARIATPRPSAL